MPLVHPDALHFDRTVDSWWEASAKPLGLQLAPLQTDANCEVAIIGGGFTGLNAAIELAQSGVDVRVLEAGPIGWGASGRNGGFVGMGAHKRSWTSLITEFGIEEATRFRNALRESVERVAANLDEFSIDARRQGDGEVALAHLPSRIAELREEQAFLRNTFGEESEFLDAAALRERGLYGPAFHAGLKSNRGFGIHPLEYVRGLARAAHGKGAILYPNSRVVAWEETGGGHFLRTATGALRARKVLVATNGYTPEAVSTRHSGRILPALSNIIVTRPLSRAELDAQGWTSPVMAYDTRDLLHYFRLLPDGRFLFGGRGGTDSSAGAAAGYREKLTGTFRQMFPAWGEAEITHFWRGHVCLSRDLVPHTGPLDEARTVWTALAYHGNGVAMASWSGRAVARLMTGNIAAKDLPAILTRRFARFPLPFLRPTYLKGAYLWLGWRDSR